MLYWWPREERERARIAADQNDDMVALVGWRPLSTREHRRRVVAVPKCPGQPAAAMSIGASPGLCTKHPTTIFREQSANAIQIWRCEKHFMWRIIQRQAAWSALRVALGKKHISSLTSTAFTILYAIKHRNTSTAWTEIIASPLDFEAGHMSEAILHRAPKVKKVMFYFFSSGIFNHFVMTRYVVTHVVCAIYMLTAGRFVKTFAHNEAETVRPAGDVFIATSSTIAAQHDPAQWRRTIALLVARRIPSVFTAVVRELSLDGVREPFGDKVHGFHAPNAWFAGGFH
ncbi:hypothetical protein GGX14DRAFT_602803 [Mycena pura]|uniref:Uncharacterized protein n=1 Tax=Mycena pura TaxID=153505 RepID=A0AAD6VMB1_9AGAR|nr:hypothetical protein GGX14DRAFT_602803 [Mycena pura]